MNKEDLKDYLVYEAEYSEKRVNKMSDYELLMLGCAIMESSVSQMIL